jgi:hypothetical protein
LCKYCILVGSEKRLDMQMLLYPFKEQFDVPTFTVQFSYGNCFMCEVVSQIRNLKTYHYHRRSVYKNLTGFMNK